jgi:elongation factor G
MCFINKINQTGGDFYKSLDSIHKRLSQNAFPIQLPIGFEKEINGVVDLINMKSYTYKDFTDKEFTVGEVPADMLEKAKEWRHKLLEKVVESDDALMEKYLGGQELTEIEFLTAIRKAVQGGAFFPVLGGDGRGIIVQKILDAVVNFLPSPVDRGSVKGHDLKTKAEIERKPSDDEPFSALDSFIAKELREELLRVWQSRNVTVIMVTHNISEAVELADRIVVMSARPGKIERIVPNRLARPRPMRGQPVFELEDELYRLVKP